MNAWTLAQYLDRLYPPIPEDASLNGLQVENSGRVNRVALAVDASFHAIQEAARRGAHFLIVHHGLYWKGQDVLPRGVLGKRLRLLFQHDIALYAMHLPMDAHPELGHNAEAARRLEQEIPCTALPFLSGMGRIITLEHPLPVRSLIRLLERVLDAPLLLHWNHGPPTVRRFAFVSGSGLLGLGEALTHHIDAFVTGESRYSAFFTLKETGVHGIFLGHYATERLGLLALKDHLELQGLEVVWIEENVPA